MNELEQEILELTKSYFTLMDEDIKEKEGFLLLLVKSAIDQYKTLRRYPESYTPEMIEADVMRYFDARKTDVAMTVIPELYGRIGSEGLSMLTDAGTTRMWTQNKIFSDVTPICEVI